MITYNHEKYISQAIEGVLMQKTNFSFELIIGEDFSTDNTSRICETFESNNPKIIKLLKPVKNLGLAVNFYRTALACKGKYIALCEGDDYWTDPYKLQKQVDLLEANTNASLCFSNAYLKSEKTGDTAILINTPYNFIFSFREYLDFKGPVPTATIVFRNYPDFFNKDLLSLLKKTQSGDYVLRWLLGDRGDFLFLNELTAVYRKHDNGISKILDNPEAILNSITTIDLLDQHTNLRYNDLVCGHPQYDYYRLYRAYMQKRSIFKSIKYFFKAIIDREKKLLPLKEIWIIKKTGLKLFIKTNS